MNRMRYGWMVLVFALIGVVAVAERGQAYSYDAWTGMTGKGTIAINPFVSGDLNASFTDVGMWAGFGLSDTADILFDFANMAGMFRYDFSGGNNVGIVALALSSTSLGLQYHMIVDPDEGIFAFEGNIYFNFPYTGMLADMSLGAYLAPVLKLGEVVSLYVEVDPSYSLADSAFALQLVPGLCFNIGDGQLSVGFPVTGLLDGSTAVSYGMWYWFPFSLGAEEAPAAEATPAES